MQDRADCKRLHAPILERESRQPGGSGRGEVRSRRIDDLARDDVARVLEWGQELVQGVSECCGVRGARAIEEAAVVTVGLDGEPDRGGPGIGGDQAAVRARRRLPSRGPRASPIPTGGERSVLRTRQPGRAQQQPRGHPRQCPRQRRGYRIASASRTSEAQRRLAGPDARVRCRAVRRGLVGARGVDRVELISSG